MSDPWALNRILTILKIYLNNPIALAERVRSGDVLVQKTSGTLLLLGSQPGELVGDKLLLSC